jgi:hypothetical protein
MRDEPRQSSTGSTGIQGEILSNIAASVINRYQSGELVVAWRTLRVTNDSAPEHLIIQEPFSYVSYNLSVINRTVLTIPPSQCREQSPCTIQPVLVAYDSAGNVIKKLGSDERPWQIKATIVNQTEIELPGSTANYSNGQTQFSLFALPTIGSFEVRFTFISPDGVNRYAKHIFFPDSS